MPKITIELTEDKLLKLIPKLLHEGTKFAVIPDAVIVKPTELIETQTVVNKPKEHKPYLFQSKRSNTLEDIIYDYVLNNDACTTKQIAKYVLSLEANYGKSSAYSRISQLFTSGKITKEIIDGITYFSVK